MKDSIKGFEILNNYGYKVVSTCTSVIIREKKFFYISIGIFILCFAVFSLLPYIIFKPSLIFMAGTFVFSFFIFMSINGYFMQSFNRVVFFEDKIVITKIKNFIIRPNVLSYHDIKDFEYEMVKKKKNQLNVKIVKQNQEEILLVSLDDYKDNDESAIQKLTTEIKNFKSDQPIAC